MKIHVHRDEVFNFLPTDQVSTADVNIISIFHYDFEKNYSCSNIIFRSDAPNRIMF